MNTNFYDAHIETLCDLQALAKKHNCKLKFGTISSSNRSNIDQDVLRYNGLSKKVIETLISGDDFYPGKFDNTYDILWFEMIENIGEKNIGEKYHNLRYIEYNCSFVIDVDDYDSLPDNIRKELDDYKCDWYDSFAECEYLFLFSGNCTKISGFGNKKMIEDYRVYREGMALKFFSDEVCDYLNEDRITRVY